MPFNQPAPRLPNQYDSDRVLRAWLARALPSDVLAAIEPELREIGALSAGELRELQLADRAHEPVHTPWDAWGNRIDRVEVSPLWQVAAPLAARHGLVAIPYEGQHGQWSRVHQMALVYLFTPSTDVYSCPLAMTDGAARTLLHHRNEPLIQRAVPHLVARDPASAWTSGQWMTESTGGSDVGLSETVAQTGGDGEWRLYGRKWFTSAVTSQMALTLARPTGNPAGGRGLALFYVELRDAEGRLNDIVVHRLKDKLGTRKVPTAELTLDGTRAVPVAGLQDGVRNIAPMLNITRTWNSVSSVSYMRRAIALARDYARRRVAFGAPLADKPLHLDTLAGMQAEFEAGFALTFHLVSALGREEAGEGTAEDGLRLRVLTPIVKLTTGKQAVAVCSEALECFGGAGYVEDTGLPVLLRDAQVFSIWEGTTNVLALEALRALAAGPGIADIRRQVHELSGTVREPELIQCTHAAQRGCASAAAWLERVMGDNAALEAGARRMALTLGRSLALALLSRQAQWALDVQGDRIALAAARRFARNGVDLMHGPGDAEDDRTLGMD